MLQTLLDKYKIPFFILIAALLILFAVLNGSKQSVPDDDKSEPLPMEITQVSSDDEIEVEPEPFNKEIFVDVKGAVLRPGIYKAVQSERVNDLIIRAGGFTSTAEDTSVNLAQRVTDEMVIYVPEEGEAGVQPASAVISEGEEVLDINQAEEKEFESLPGIGPAKAKAIFDYRSENGPFKNIEELMQVSGIGEGTFEKLKEHITVN
ncbi:ComEA family DNA-binding protein [Rossellomorea vietnamensis]|uniref:ComEA family DNA-binding protein n=1 Tax=Rossellomorea vietnamensis TaxID=218284 RepID=A0A5D4MGP8_9BACI|nr:helix-hairpin-helix domain-containing protein [Rossellomorea vietnamensis]TYS00822.1 ComEA family DNA-binding protein [Rossellomorea vietnamensis]